MMKDNWNTDIENAPENERFLACYKSDYGVDYTIAHWFHDWNCFVDDETRTIEFTHYQKIVGPD